MSLTEKAARRYIASLTEKAKNEILLNLMLLRANNAEGDVAVADQVCFMNENAQEYEQAFPEGW